MTKRPVIGITYSDSSLRDNSMRIRTYVSRKYFRAIYASGGLPILLPAIDPYFHATITDSNEIFPKNYDQLVDQYLNMVDGLVFPGGEDVHPKYQNEDPHVKLDLVNPFRDEFELAMAKAAYSRTYNGKRLPALGICRGIQVMAIALGGMIHQDISDICKMQHSQQAPRWETSHKISIKRETRLAKLLSTDSIFTNSFHHQAVKKLPKGFMASAHTADSIIEAIEAQEQRFFVGVQWHPEETFATDTHSKNLFKELVAAAQN
jgi:putative glutamine amidotransferase